MNMPGEEYIAATMRSSVPGLASAALARPDTPHRIVAAMYSSPGMFIVRGDSPYRSIADLQGKTVVLGTQGSGITLLGRTVLAALEVPVNAITLEKAADGPPMLLDGRAAALWGAGVGWPAFTAPAAAALHALDRADLGTT